MVSRALLIAVLAAMPADALAQCTGELNECEASLYETGVIWESRSKHERLKLDACLARLRVRTSTAVNAMVVPAASDGGGAFQYAAIVGTAGVIGAVLGVVLGLIAN